MWRRRQPAALPVPPPEMRDLIGGAGPERFDNPSGEPVYDYPPADAYDSVFDFGSGCGRVARQLIQQQPRPRRYLGVDLHAGMVEWCRRELAPHAPGFRFEHHDIYNAGLNPEGRNRTLPLPADDGEFTLFNAISVFTHSTQDQAEHYLQEAARVLRPDGWLHASCFCSTSSCFR
jgi:SAM-dependent methyltransferase